MLNCKHINRVFLLLLLIIGSSSLLFSQDPDSTRLDTANTKTLQTLQINNNTKEVKISEDMPEEIIDYQADDSIVGFIQKKLVYLYGNAQVKYGDEMTLTSERMIVDMKKNEVMATYALDSAGKPYGKPLFKDGTDEIHCDSIRYNFKTRKAYITEVRMQQGEGYIHMSKSKRHANEEIHLKGGKYTTCDLEEPHFHFNMTKAVIVPNKRIATGPVNLWVAGVPTPLGLPFGYFPNSEDKAHGILFPQFPVNNYGFGVQDLGYYIPLNDRMDLSVYGTIYTKGSWGTKGKFRYKKRYKNDGSLMASFSQFRDPFPEKTFRNKFELRWLHKQDPKANPTSNFDADINFMSDNSPQQSLEDYNQNYLNNQFNSAINYNKSFAGTPFSLSAKASLQQNSNTRVFNIMLPQFSFNMNRIFPFSVFRKTKTGKKKWYEQIGLTYSMDAQNRLDIVDTVLYASNVSQIFSEMQNGIKHNVRLAGNFKLGSAGLVTMSPNINYNERWNFQYIDKEWNNDTQKIDTIEQSGFGSSRDVSASLNFQTNIYGMYYFRDKKKSILRHVLTPSLAFSYTPNISNYETAYLGNQGGIVQFSPYEQSVFRETVSRSSGIVTLNLLNNFELKQKDTKDTTKEFKKIKIIDAFNVNANYDIFKDSLNFSDIGFSMRSSPFPFLNIVANARLSPYGWDSTGRDINQYAYNVNKKLGRFRSADIAFSLRLTSKKGYQKQQQTQELFDDYWGAEVEYLRAHPDYIIDFDVPWSLNFNYKIAYNRRTIGDVDTSLVTQTLSFSGDVNITKNWKVKVSSGFDFKSKKFTYTVVDVYRDLHCWELNFKWIPFGGNKSYTLRINVKASMLKDMAIERKRPRWDY